ncbi:MAG: cupredoxin domain-containing protein [Gaiellaceae bacterium]
MRRVLIAAVLLLAGCGSDDGADEGSSSGGETVQITATDFRFGPADVSVEAAGETTFTLTNDGGEEHALEIEGNGLEEETDDVPPGESATLTVELEPGEYELYCPIENHRELGMEGTLVVGGSAGAGTTTTETETGEDDGYGR